MTFVRLGTYVQFPRTFVHSFASPLPASLQCYLNQPILELLTLKKLIMSNLIQVPTRDQVDAKAQGIFDNLKKQLGTVPNLYATIGYSGDALGNFLAFSGAAGGNSFTKKEKEAIDLAVSEVNACAYCLAAHTTLGKMAGFTEAETIALRAGTIADERLLAITKLAANISQNRGKANRDLIENFFAQGFDEKALIDLLSAITAITFTNYVHGTTKVPVDFPAAKTLIDLPVAA